MATKEKQVQPATKNITDALTQPQALAPDAQAQMEAMMKKLDDFKTRLVGKFEGYIAGIALLPQGRTLDEIAEMELPPEAQTKKEKNPNEISVLVLVDDTDSQKMTKQELKDKLSEVIGKMGREVDANINAQVLIYSELWQYCFDGKTEILQLIASCAPVYDLGMLNAIKITEVHKTMVLKKFEKYIVSYVLAGSLVQGKATATSDIDVFIVIDDTDVKKMTRVELKDRLRSIIIGMSLQAGEMTGVTNKLNIQTYILTDFWDSIKEANPVIFTFLRDGVPFYDRGIFMPWKQLLRMGKVKPSMEAIEMYLQSGEQMLDRTKFKLQEIGMEDTYWAILYPSQAALMLYGLAPPTPRETPELLRKVFVKKEKILEEKYVKILESNIQLRKELEHGTKKKVTGAEIDKCITDAHDFLTRVKKLFEDIQDRQMQQGIVHLYDHVMTLARDVLKLEGIASIADKDLIDLFTKIVVEKGHAPQKLVRMIETVVKAKEDHDKGTLHKAEIEKVRLQSQELIRSLIEYVQRKRGIELERMKIKVKYGSKFGEVIMLDKIAYIVHDIDAPEKQYSKAQITKTGGLAQIDSSSAEELEKELVKITIPQRAFIKDQIFVDLKKIFGNDVEVLVNY